MLLHAGAGAGIQCHPGGGHRGDSGHDLAADGLAGQRDREHAACAWHRDCATGNIAGLQPLPADEPCGGAVLLGVRERTLSVGCLNIALLVKVW